MHHWLLHLTIRQVTTYCHIRRDIGQKEPRIKNRTSSPKTTCSGFSKGSNQDPGSLVAHLQTRKENQWKGTKEAG
jgi:hypothetical protein